MAEGRRDKSPDPLGKRALFWVPSAREGAAPGTGAASHRSSTKAINLSAGLPLDVRLIGGQVIGLAVLAAAVTIAVARLSLRRQPQPPGEDGPGGS